jgi:hypothetical protein
MMALRNMTLGGMVLSIATLRKIPLIKMPLSLVIINKMTLSRTTLSIMILSKLLSVFDIQYNDIQNSDTWQNELA